METGFQVVVGAALGCQLVPPVILFSPGWFQWMSLEINTCWRQKNCRPEKASSGFSRTAEIPHLLFHGAVPNAEVWKGNRVTGLLFLGPGALNNVCFD